MIRKGSLLDLGKVDNQGVFLIDNSINKLPDCYFYASLNLFFYFARQSLEVGTWLFLHKESQQLILAVPRQEVTTYSIYTYSLDCIDLITGKPIKHSEYFKIGSYHSHHQLATIFSFDDDESDFYSPKGIHLLIGNIVNEHSFFIKASYVESFKRFYFQPNMLLPTFNINLLASYPYHSKCLEYVTLPHINAV